MSGLVEDRTAFTAIVAEQQKLTTCNEGASISNARDEIFKLGAIVGQMCTLFLTVPHDSVEMKERPSLDDDSFWIEDSDKKEEVANQMAKVFLQLFATASICSIDLCTSILKKIELNGRKYPVELCKVGDH